MKKKKKTEDDADEVPIYPENNSEQEDDESEVAEALNNQFEDVDEAERTHEETKESSNEVDTDDGIQVDESDKLNDQTNTSPGEELATEPSIPQNCNESPAANLPSNNQHSGIEASNVKQSVMEDRSKQAYNYESSEDHPVDNEEDCRKTTTAAAFEASDDDSVNDDENLRAKRLDKDFDCSPFSSPLWTQAARGNEILTQLSYDPLNMEKVVDTKYNTTLQDSPSFPNEPADELKQRSTAPRVVRKAEVTNQCRPSNSAESYTSTLEPDSDYSSEDDQFAFPGDDSEFSSQTIDP